MVSIKYNARHIQVCKNRIQFCCIHAQRLFDGQEPCKMIIGKLYNKLVLLSYEEGKWKGKSLLKCAKTGVE